MLLLQSHKSLRGEAALSWIELLLLQAYQESLQAHEGLIAKDVNVVKAVMDIKELSNYIHRTVSWIYQNKREIPRIQKGQKGTLYFRKNEIDKWLNGYKE